MDIRGLDHLVLTTENLSRCLDFYGGLLGLAVEESGGRYAIRIGRQKINIHQRPAEFLPAAGWPLAGSLDLCFAVTGDIEVTLAALREKGAVIIQGPVPRHGAAGDMQSLYLRDPDGNLVELGFYDEGPTQD
ncbi:MAG: VOC family protein [Schwartzia sp.]|nr:VOC family protein [Schwartzia sp. (in: firmicutes)]